MIRTGFIYQPASVSLVGTSKILVGSAAFANAREPLAQAFKTVGTPDADGFAVIVNHFKSKGSGVDDGTGQGNANPDRVAQANALVTFANQFQTDRGVTRTFLVGDFNAYSHEDPIDVLTGGGLHRAATRPATPTRRATTSTARSARSTTSSPTPRPRPTSTGVDVWPINGYESVYYEYSRFNYNVTNLYSTGPFRSSDHSPEIVGIDVPRWPSRPRTIQILGTNDFHGRLQNDATAADRGCRGAGGCGQAAARQEPRHGVRGGR